MRTLTTRTAGLALLVAGIWAGFIPFVGPYFHFALGPDKAWSWTSGRLWLDVLPAAAVAIGGLVLAGRHLRVSGRFGALLALAGGAWLAVGPTVSRLWQASGAQGVGHGARGTRVLEQLTFHTGLGVLVAVLATYALSGPRLSRVAVHEAVAAPVPEPEGAGEDTIARSHRPQPMRTEVGSYDDRS